MSEANCPISPNAGKDATLMIMEIHVQSMYVLDVKTGKPDKLAN